MVAVGDDDRMIRKRGTDGGALGTLRHNPKVVVHAVSGGECDHRGTEGDTGEQVGESCSGSHHPDGREVGVGGSHQFEPVAAGLGRRVLMGEDVRR